MPATDACTVAGQGARSNHPRLLVGTYTLLPFILSEWTYAEELDLEAGQPS